MPNYEDTNPADFEEIEKTELAIETSPDGTQVTIKGLARGHRVWIRRDSGDKERPVYVAIVDDYAEIVGENAELLFEKYIDLAKYKARL